ncbi:thermonuclease family protein [Devosia sp. Root685]|uniref:thermonuclease family protein n=1 Tax=Devosia sp. Root685 TaxID=1736587 RepID=UPI001FCD6EAB|nr:thermonuclease family protein [Devosia sp. Root685]
MRGTTLISTAAFALLASAPLACESLTMAPGGVVVEVTDGDTVVLDDGRKIRLIGTQAPKLPLGREDFVSWPLAPEAQRALADLALNKTVRLGFGGEAIDRHERVLAHMFVETEEGEVWAQLFMVGAGLARVYSFPDNRQCLEPLFAAEARARADRLGIWANPYYSVRAADRPGELLDRVGHYELVEGRVLLADRSGSRIFLNFGRFWKEDFTAVIEGPALRLFEKDELDPLVLEGALVRIRGWVDDRDGPRIEVTHPEQIEVLATR